jgi:hypothetical protein
MELDKIEVVTDYKHLQIREITDSGGYHRRVLTSDMDVSGETQTIQRGTDENGDPIMKTVKEIAEELWTDEVKTAWTTFQAEQEAEMNPE